MNKKIAIILILNIGILSLTAFSQFSSNFFTSEQQFIKQATEDVLYIVRQDYVLRDTTSVNPNEYGLGGNDYFGRIYRLAVLSENKLWCDNSVMIPWYYDENYEEYKDNNAIKPMLSKVVIRKINERDFKPIKLSQMQTTSYDTLIEKLSLHNYNLADSVLGITNKREVKTGTSWIILASTKEDIRLNDTCDIKLSIYRLPAEFKDNKLDAIVSEPTITDNLLGGIYFNENISIGKIEMFFTGILNKRILNWYVSTIPNDIEVITNQPINTNTLSIISGQVDSVSIKFINKRGLPIENLCNITIEYSDQEFCTNENGIIKIPTIQNDSKILVFLNGKGAVCINNGENYKVVCKNSGGVFIPKKIVKNCR